MIGTDGQRLPLLELLTEPKSLEIQIQINQNPNVLVSVEFDEYNDVIMCW